MNGKIEYRALWLNCINKVIGSAQICSRSGVLFPSSFILVGIEPNPGPPKKNKKKIVKSSKSPLVNGIASRVGQVIGGYLGGPSGSRLGKSAGDLFSKVTGLGSYRLARNSLVTSSGSVAQFSGTENGVRVCHREYIGEITTSTNFSINKYILNPGDSTTFPWLSSIARNFEQWIPQGILFYFNPTCGTAISSTNPAQGAVIFATEYDISEPPFSTKLAMENHEFCTSTVTYEPMYHPVECKPSQTTVPTKLVFSSDTGVSADRQLYDLGNFFVATQGSQSSFNAGELWVTYDVLLLKPHLESIYSGSAVHLKSYPNDTCRSASGVLGTAASTANCTALGSTLGMVTVTDANTIRISYTGTYLILTVITSSDVQGTNISFTPGANLSPLTVWNKDTINNRVAQNSGGSIGFAACVYSVLYQGISSLNELVFTPPTGLSTGANNLDMFICKIPTSLVTVLLKEEQESKEFSRLLQNFLASRSSDFVKIDEECKSFQPSELIIDKSKDSSSKTLLQSIFGLK